MRKKKTQKALEWTKEVAILNELARSTAEIAYNSAKRALQIQEEKEVSTPTRIGSRNWKRIIKLNKEMNIFKRNLETLKRGRLTTFTSAMDIILMNIAYGEKTIKANMKSAKWGF